MSLMMALTFLLPTSGKPSILSAAFSARAIWRACSLFALPHTYTSTPWLAGDADALAWMEMNKSALVRWATARRSASLIKLSPLRVMCTV